MVYIPYFHYFHFHYLALYEASQNVLEYLQKIPHFLSYFGFVFATASVFTIWQVFVGWVGGAVNPCSDLLFLFVSYSQEHRGHQSSGARAPELWCPFKLTTGLENGLQEYQLVPSVCMCS